MPFIVTKQGTGELTYAQTRRATLRTPTRGVRTAATAKSWIDLVQAVALTLPRDAVFSHTTAARLLGLPTPPDTHSAVHVTVPKNITRGSRKAVTWHQRDISNFTEVAKGLPVTNPRQTWVDLASCIDMPQLVAVTDVMLRRGLLKITDLVVPRGVRGAQTLRVVASLADPRSRSVRETLLRVALHKEGLPAPEINLDIIEDGVWLGTGDLVWPEYRLVIEYDGIHHDQPRQRHQDAQTRNAYAEHGWLCIVLTSVQFDHLHDTVEQIVRVMGQRGWRPPPPSL